MKLNRFYVGAGNAEEKDVFDIFEDSCVLRSTSLLHQLKSVFRFTKGDECVLFDDNQYEYHVKLLSLQKDRGDFEIISKTLVDEKINNVSLYMSVIKKDLFELVAQKVTEIGISKITPIQSERTIVKNLSEDRLEKIVVEATEQSGGISIPKIEKILKLEEAINSAIKSEEKIIVADVADRDSLERIKREENKVALFIGPEGGWGEEDQKTFSKFNVTKVSLGQKVLRAETAAIVGVWELGK
jgi:16S rRNA (uracil1498-N3)-methyltransferase